MIPGPYVTFVCFCCPSSEKGSFPSVKNTVSLKENHLFRRLYQKGRSAVCPDLALYARKNNRPGNRLGLTVSTKVGHAVVRNRVRRRLREIYRLNREGLMPGYDLIVVARARAARSSYRQLERDFLRLSDKLGLKKGAGEP